MKYDYIIDENSFARQTSHSQIVSMVKNNSDVLEIGCSTGFMSKYLKEKKDCRVVGVEINSSAANKAKLFCKQVIVGNIEDDSVFNEIDAMFDVIIFADVLEHLVTPDKILLKIKKFLKSDGFILISIPNIAYWRIRKNLLFGKFEYTTEGILDKTHLRFFTLKSIKKMIQDCGYYIVSFGVAGGRMPIFLRKLWATFFTAQFIFKIKSC